MTTCELCGKVCEEDAARKSFGADFDQCNDCWRFGQQLNPNMLKILVKIIEFQVAAALVPKPIRIDPVSSEMVKVLREKTGAGMGDCKKALFLARGSMRRAEAWLRVHGTAVMRMGPTGTCDNCDEVKQGRSLQGKHYCFDCYAMMSEPF